MKKLPLTMLFLSSYITSDSEGLYSFFLTTQMFSQQYNVSYTARDAKTEYAENCMLPQI
jgi:hypothetical protein